MRLLLRTIVVLVPLVLLGPGWLPGAWAGDGASPDSATIVLPAPPEAAVTLDREDVTGTIAETLGSAPADSVAHPDLAPLLRADEPVTSPSLLAGIGSGPQPVLSATPESVPPPPLDMPPPAADTTSPAADATPPARGLTAAALWQALPGFATAQVEGETQAQAAERRRIREAVATFYAAHADGPLWVAGDHLTAAAHAVLDRLDHAAEDGLDLRGFAVPVPRGDDAASLLRAELGLSEAAVAYARQASGSRVDVAALGVLIDARPQVADADRVLGTVPGAPDAGEALRAFNPPQPGYAALREKLADLRRGGAEAQVHIPYGPMLKPGMRDARVPLIRARFGLDAASGDEPAADRTYDTQVAAAVADFQRANHLPASGVLTTRTVAALSGGNPTRLENAVLANMEEWRWMPRDLGADHIEVNIPEFTARVLRDGEVTRSTRVVVGKPDHPTPVFSQVMKFIIVNPYWNVPVSIIKKEMLPKLAADPNYFADHGYEVVERNGQTYVRQPPGDGNALGRIKFMFPNSHSVYLHDTNAKGLFARDERALSHGCVRVEDPFAFAEAVLGTDNGWTEARVERMVGGDERTISLPEPLPIHIVYFPAFVDPEAGFDVRGDVYGYMGKVEAALGLQG